MRRNSRHAATATTTATKSDPREARRIRGRMDYFPQLRTEYVPPLWTATDSGRQRQPDCWVQSLLPKHTSVQTFATESQKLLLQSVLL
jgi:hypothetical protein